MHVLFDLWTRGFRSAFAYDSATDSAVDVKHNKQ